MADFAEFKITAADVEFGYSFTPEVDLFTRAIDVRSGAAVHHVVSKTTDAEDVRDQRHVRHVRFDV